MSSYPLTWITRNLAVGHAPMSYAELDSIKEQGINAIVNLCGEFSDLHEIEEEAGFEVLFLPIPDEMAPAMAEMEAGLAWLDEAVYLGKKVLIHCRHGIGRTGTFVTAYLLRRGYDLKKAGKMLKASQARANPTNFSQWWLLRKFGKKEGKLTITEPTPDNRNPLDLSAYYQRYEVLQQRADALCGTQEKTCCLQAGGHSCNSKRSLELVEALYLNNTVNIGFSTEKRQTVIGRATGVGKGNSDEAEALEDTDHGKQVCPLYEDGSCMLNDFRPINCRLNHLGTHPDKADEVRCIQDELNQLSRELFSMLFTSEPDLSPPLVSVADTVSGKFIQEYFRYLATGRSNHDK